MEACWDSALDGCDAALCANDRLACGVMANACNCYVATGSNKKRGMESSNGVRALRC